MQLNDISALADSEDKVSAVRDLDLDLAIDLSGLDLWSLPRWFSGEVGSRAM